MRTVWQVFLRDCRRILRNPVAVVVTLGVAMLPSLYAWFNILANWDPYSATGNLLVAEANEDQGTTYDLVGHLDAGRQVVKKLKQNDELGWRFVDNEEQAVHGVETGGYYAAIVLPKDFSTSLVESVTGTSKQPKIKYYVNEKKNAIAPKITDTGATTIDEQINSAFVTTVATTVASAVSEAGGDLDQATGKVQHDTINDLNTVMSTLNTVQDSLTDLQDTLAQSDTILADAKQTTASLKQTVAAAQKASRQTGTLLTETPAGSQAFSPTLVGALDTSSAQLSGLADPVNTAAGRIVAHDVDDLLEQLTVSGIDYHNAARNTVSKRGLSGVCHRGKGLRSCRTSGRLVFSFHQLRTSTFTASAVMSSPRPYSRIAARTTLPASVFMSPSSKSFSSRLSQRSCPSDTTPSLAITATRPGLRCMCSSSGAFPLSCSRPGAKDVQRSFLSAPPDLTYVGAAPYL